MKTRREIVDGIMLPIEEDARHPDRAYSTRERLDGSTFRIWCGWGDEGTDQVAIAKDIRVKLEERLSVAETFKTCGDFVDLNVRCCEDDHSFYPMYEMSVVPLPEGGFAWLCCAIDHALRPEWHAEQDRLFDQSEKGKILREFWPDMCDANGNRRPFTFEKIDNQMPFPWERSGAPKNSR